MKTTVSFKLDKDVRDRARRAAKAVGLPLSTIVNNQLKHFAEERRIVFTEERLKPSVIRELQKARDDFKKGKNTSPPFTDAESAIRWLNS